LRSATYWLFGGFGLPTFGDLLAPAVALIVVFVVLQRRAERLDRLVLGDDVAASLGTDPRRLRALVLTSGIVLTALSVAAGGLIGFVGLIAPHAARRLVGPSHRAVVPTAALLGGALVILADLVARTTFAPREVPLGLVTALLGGPLFLWLVARSARWA
jgi:iron complex transport system permease protein